MIKPTFKIIILSCSVLLFACQSNESTVSSPPTATTKLLNNQLVISDAAGQSQTFGLNFTLLYRESDPKMKLLPASIPNVKYNVPTWLAVRQDLADVKAIKRDASQSGDGFDDSILNGSADSRTNNYFASGRNIQLTPEHIQQEGSLVFVDYVEQPGFSLRATVDISSKPYPLVSFELNTKQAGYYSVGYSGAPAISLNKADEIWQPMIWQEKKFPDNSYLTLAYRAPLPTTLVRQGQSNIGVLAHPDEFPFSPLPLADNSRFGIVLRNTQGDAQPMLFAPVMGGIESHMGSNEKFHFRFYLVNQQAEQISGAFEHIARDVYGFRDYRHNEIASLNTTFDNIVDYSLSSYAWFVDKLKGSAYSTDVPGAVKNVTSLSALELAMVTDNKTMFEKRAYPTLEYMLSREKFLFSLDPEQKIQHPSRKMLGPIAPVSELTSLYNILGQNNPFLVTLAKEAFNSSRVRNLDVAQQGNTWYNALWIYKSTGDENFLQKAIEGADQYLANRVNQPAEKFDEHGFFWTQYTPKFIELLELYEVTQEQRYLDGAQKAARQYTMFTWMAPKIPQQDVLVNKDGLAPMYWYLKSKGHKQMYAKEEFVAPWKLSETGLTPESSGTSSGHRAIFMANYAPWMLRIGYYSNDSFLKEVAKAAIIGRYSNFPGYHINTARTTIYEKPDYPLHKHKELSVNSFHYNHILPQASMLLDYLVTDVLNRSDGQISFPSEYIEGYAYLQNKFYGHKPGKFYDEEGVNLWMPKGLLSIDNVELNYIAGYRGDDLFIAFTNQSDLIVNATATINPDKVNLADSVSVKSWQQNQLTDKAKLDGNALRIQVKAQGITVVKLSGAKTKVIFKDKLQKHGKPINNDYLEIEAGNARAMLIQLGELGNRAYIYLRDDDSKVSSFELTYTDSNGQQQTLSDNEFPYELTVELPAEQRQLEFSLKVTDINNQQHNTGPLQLGQ